MILLLNVPHKVWLDFTGGKKKLCHGLKYRWHRDTVFGAVGSQPMFLLSLQQGQTWLDCNWAKLINNLSKDNHNHLDNGPSLFVLLQVCTWTDAASYLHHSIFNFIKLKIKHKQFVGIKIWILRTEIMTLVGCSCLLLLNMCSLFSNSALGLFSSIGQ